MLLSRSEKRVAIPTVIARPHPIIDRAEASRIASQAASALRTVVLERDSWADTPTELIARVRKAKSTLFIKNPPYPVISEN